MKIINKFLIAGLFLVGLLSCSSKIECPDLKQGNFIISSDTEGTEPYKIVRNDTLQTEINNEGVARYSKIKWLSDCSYILFYDEDKMVLNDFQKEVNEVGGVIVEVTKIEGNCFYYTSNIIGDPHSERIDGVMCKE